MVSHNVKRPSSVRQGAKYPLIFIYLHLCAMSVMAHQQESLHRIVPNNVFSVVKFSEFGLNSFFNATRHLFNESNKILTIKCKV